MPRSSHSEEVQRIPRENDKHQTVYQTAQRGLPARDHTINKPAIDNPGKLRSRINQGNKGGQMTMPENTCRKSTVDSGAHSSNLQDSLLARVP